MELGRLIEFNLATPQGPDRILWDHTPLSPSFRKIAFPQAQESEAQSFSW
jgi:hypothetical protein